MLQKIKHKFIWIITVIFYLLGDAHADYCTNRNQLNSPFYVWILTSFNNFFLVLNSSINFVVYCFVGRRFRNTLISFFKKPSSNAKNLAPHTQDGITQSKMQSLGGLSSDLYPTNSRKPSCTYSPHSIRLPEIIEDSNMKTEQEKKVSKVITGNKLVVNTDELASLSSSDTITQHHKNRATFIW